MGSIYARVEHEIDPRPATATTSDAFDGSGTSRFHLPPLPPNNPARSTPPRLTLAPHGHPHDDSGYTSLVDSLAVAASDHGDFVTYATSSNPAHHSYHHYDQRASTYPNYTLGQPPSPFEYSTPSHDPHHPHRPPPPSLFTSQVGYSSPSHVPSCTSRSSDYSPSTQHWPPQAPLDTTVAPHSPSSFGIYHEGSATPSSTSTSASGSSSYPISAYDISSPAPSTFSQSAPHRSRSPPRRKQNRCDAPGGTGKPKDAKRRVHVCTHPGCGKLCKLLRPSFASARDVLP
jgi:hypothetical protein